jgi:hypothetical protein
VELYLHSPIRLHGVVLSEAQGQLYLYLTSECLNVIKRGHFFPLPSQSSIHSFLPSLTYSLTHSLHGAGYYLKS